MVRLGAAQDRDVPFQSGQEQACRHQHHTHQVQAEPAFMTGTNVTRARLDGGTDTSPDLPGSFQGTKGDDSIQSKTKSQAGAGAQHRSTCKALGLIPRLAGGGGGG